jgi:(2Fe-2S) ferredoxin
MAAFERHVFICTNQRMPDSPRGCCDPEGKRALQSLFKAAVARRGLKGRVRANSAGCLDQCEHGPSVVVYPEGVWYGFVTAADVEEIVESHLVNGVPVERLRIADACVNAKSCPHRAPREEAPVAR